MMDTFPFFFFLVLSPSPTKLVRDISGFDLVRYPRTIVFPVFLFFPLEELFPSSHFPVSPLLITGVPSRRRWTPPSRWKSPFVDLFLFFLCGHDHIRAVRGVIRFPPSFLRFDSCPLFFLNCATQRSFWQVHLTIRTAPALGRGVIDVAP